MTSAHGTAGISESGIFSMIKIFLISHIHKGPSVKFIRWTIGDLLLSDIRIVRRFIRGIRGRFLSEHKVTWNRLGKGGFWS